MTGRCARCENANWVCETHPTKPWTEDRNGCQCNAGVPCPDCNASTGRDDPPRDPAGFKSCARTGPGIQ